MNDTAIQPPGSLPAAVTTVRRSLAPTTWSETLEFAKQLASSSMVPQEFRGRPENIVLAMQWGMELGLAPMQAIQNIAVINGKPSVYGDALLAMVRGSPVCDDVIERFEGEGENYAAVCEARRKGKAPVFGKFSVADAKRAKLWGKQGPWTQYPERMMQMRARGFALRDAFPDVLRGVITAEEAADYPVDVATGRPTIDITPKADLDAFAASTTEAPVVELARAAAAKGIEAFRALWNELSGEERDALRPDIASYRQAAQDADARAAAQRDEDPFGLPPLSRPGADTSDAGEHRAGAGDAHKPLADALAELEPQPADLVSGGGGWRGYAEAAVALIRAAAPGECRELRTGSLPHLMTLRSADGDLYRTVTAALTERGKAEAKAQE